MVDIDIKINEMYRSVGYEFQIRSILREKEILSDSPVNCERKISSIVFDRNKDANLKEIASRNFEREKILKKI